MSKKKNRKKQKDSTERTMVAVAIIFLLILFSIIFASSTGYLTLESEARGHMINVFPKPENPSQGQIVSIWTLIRNSGNDGELWCRWTNIDTGQLLDETRHTLDQGKSATLIGEVEVPPTQVGTLNILAEVGHDNAVDDTWELHISITVVPRTVSITAIDDDTGSPVAGAEVNLGENIKYTSFNGKVEFFVSAGTYGLMIRHPEYWMFVLDGLITVTDSNLDLTYRLRPYIVEYPVTVEVSDYNTNLAVENATVTIGSETQLTNEYGMAFFEFEGDGATYTILVTKTGYYDSTQEITIFDSGKSVTFNLVPIEEPEEPGQGTPGFEMLTLFVALGIAFVLLRWRKK